MTLPLKRKLKTVLYGLLVPMGALAQSDPASMVSAVSVAPASAAIEATLAAVPAGAHWVVKGVGDSATGASVVLEASGTGVIVSVGVGLETAGHLAHAIGRTVEVVAVSTGYVLYLGAEAIAYVPNGIGRAMLHHRELGSRELGSRERGSRESGR